MTRFFTIYILALAAMAFPAFALTPRECVDSALANNPSLAAAALEVRRAEIMKATAFNPPMTEVTLKQETTGGGGPENGVYFGQEFDFPSLYVARGKSLEAQRSLEESRCSVLASELEKEVLTAWYSLCYYDALLRQNAEMGKDYDEFCRVAAVRLEQGECGTLEVMNAERVREKNLIDGQSLRSEYEAALLELRRLTGITSPVVLSADDFCPVPLGSQAAGSFNFTSTARGLAASREVTAAEREGTVARNELLPSLRLGATVQALIKSFNPYHIERLPFEKGNFMGFEVGVSIPLFFGAGGARIKAADTRRQISMLRLEAADSEANAEVTRLKSRVESLASRLDYFRQTALPRAAEIRRIAHVSYGLGDISYIELIANLETAASICRDYADCLNEYNLSVINLNNLCQ